MEQRPKRLLDQVRDAVLSASAALLDALVVKTALLNYSSLHLKFNIRMIYRLSPVCSRNMLKRLVGKSHICVAKSYKKLPFPGLYFPLSITSIITLFSGAAVELSGLSGYHSGVPFENQLAAMHAVNYRPHVYHPCAGGVYHPCAGDVYHFTSFESAIPK